MKKRLIILLILAVSFVFIFSACTDKNKIATGKFYLENNENVYIEIINKSEISFSNVDFSTIQANLDELGFEIDVNESLMGINCYDVNEDFDRIYVDIYEDIFLTIVYSKENKTLTLNGRIYILES